MTGARREQIGNCTLYLGDCREISLSQNDFQAVLTDPPYGMSFQSGYRNQKHKKITGDSDSSLLAEIRRPRSLITWVKNNWSMGDLKHEHARQTEVAAFYPGPSHDFPKGRPQDVIRAPRSNNDHHPTEKPVQLMGAMLEWSRGVVFDPFMGSGTTGVACARFGREFIGVELEEAYFDTACRRIEEAYNQPELFVEQPKE